jgi:hypothetical protein
MQSILKKCESGSGGWRIKSNTCGRSVSLGIVLLTFLVLCILEAGCHDVATTWLAEARSPDQQWLATARTQQWGGPGTAYDATTVYLKEVKASQAPTRILVFSHQYATMNLKMAWITPTHLSVSYGPSAKPGDRVSLDFEVVKMNGIDISVRELSSNVGTSR